MTGIARDRESRLTVAWFAQPPADDEWGRVVVTGVFDILHLGHVRFLNWAAEQGEHLYVGVDSDERVRAWKGDGRPIHQLAERAEMLSSLKAVGRVFCIHGHAGVCGPSDYAAMLRPVRPAVLAYTTGDPHSEAKRVGAHALDARVCEFALQRGYSTSALLKRLAR